MVNWFYTGICLLREMDFRDLHSRNFVMHGVISGYGQTEWIYLRLSLNREYDIIYKEIHFFMCL